MPLNSLRCVGASLLDHSGDVVAAQSVLTGQPDYVGLFFSAEWAHGHSDICDQLKSLSTDGKTRLQLIYVSSDKEEAAFQATLAHLQTCFAIPFKHHKNRVRVTRQFNINSLPFLVLLKGRTGELASRVSRETLARDPHSENFPWSQRPLKDVLTTANIRDPQGKPVSYETLKDGVKALYFSANWCPPCKAFTPQLIATYEKIKLDGHKFEIIFVSSDRSEESWKSYHGMMPWPSIEWRDHETRKELADALEVKGIPSLVILDSNLSVITRDGRNIINEDPQAKEFPWRTQSVEILRGIHMQTVLDKPCLILFTDDDQTELQFGVDVLLPAAEEYYADNPEDGGISMAFFVTGENDVSERIREEANLDDVVPLLAIIDVKEGTKYLLEEGVEISNSTVHNFVSRFTKDQLTALAIDSDHGLFDDKIASATLPTNEDETTCEDS